MLCAFFAHTRICDRTAGRGREEDSPGCTFFIFYNEWPDIRVRAILHALCFHKFFDFYARAVRVRTGFSPRATRIINLGIR